MRTLGTRKPIPQIVREYKQRYPNCTIKRIFTATNCRGEKFLYADSIDSEGKSLVITIAFLDYDKEFFSRTNGKK